MHQCNVHGRKANFKCDFHNSLRGLSFPPLAIDTVLGNLTFLIRSDPYLLIFDMNKSWGELAVALDGILPSEKRVEKTPSTVVSAPPTEEEKMLKSPEPKRQVQDTTLPPVAVALQEFLEREGDKFHPADVVLGYMPFMARDYFPGTPIFYRRADAYWHLCGGSSKGREEFGNGDMFDPVITREEYADLLMNSTQKQGGRFLQLDPVTPGFDVVDRELAHVLIVQYIAIANRSTGQALSTRTKWIPNNFKKSTTSDTPVPSNRKRLSKEAIDPKTKALKAKKHRLTKPMPKSSNQRENLKNISTKPAHCSTYGRGSRCPRFQHVVPPGDRKERRSQGFVSEEH